MWYTLWLAFPNQMIVIDIHPIVEQSSKNDTEMNLLSVPMKEECNQNILLYGKRNRYLSQSCWTRIYELFECTQRNYKNSITRKRNMYNIYVEAQSIECYVHVVLRCFINRNLTALIERIFLNSVLNYNFD